MLERSLLLLQRLSRSSPWRRAVAALAVLAVVAGGYLAFRPPSRPAGEFRRAEAEDGEEEKPRQLTVHVAGAVVHPGVVLLPEGARVIDAIEAAGGSRDDADLEALNLAQTLEDGQKITVAAKGAPGAASPATPAQSSRVNLNAADREALEKLPGIGPTLAERIIAYREKKGGFRSVEELKQVSGIGAKKFEEIRDLVEV